MTTNWKLAGVVSEGQPIRIGKLNPWKHDWTSTKIEDVHLPHPSYPDQLHRMSVYEINDGSSTVRFAAGELSMNVWGFYEADG